MVHVGHLAGGNYAVAVLSFLAIAVSARTLSPTEYGILALTISFARAVERFVSFQSWQALIRFGAGLRSADDRGSLKVLMKFGLMLDLLGAIAAWLVAVVCAGVAGHLIGWSGATAQLVLVYASVLLFNINGLPTAVLRLAGRFAVINAGQAIGAALRLVLCIVAAVVHADLMVFGLIWMSTQILASLLLLGITLRQLRMDGLGGWLKAPLAGVGQRFPGIWSFAFSANLSLTLRSSANQLDMLWVGAFAGPAAAGLYHIAKQVARMVQQMGAQVLAVVYPDVARLWAEGSVGAFRRAVLQVELLLAALGVAAAIGTAIVAEPLLRLAMGPAFAAAAPLLVVQMIAVLLGLGGSGAYSALLAMGRERIALTVVILGTIAFHLTAVILIPRIGPMGANVAHLVLGGICMAGLTIAFRRALAAGGTPPRPQPARAVEEVAEPSA